MHATSALILFTLPFALVGGVWLLYLLGYDLSIAAAVGFIALAGVAAETGVVMVMYLEHAWAERRARATAESREPTRRELREAIVEGALLRLRPKLMTVITIIVGLLPIMWGSGTGCGRHATHRGADGRRHGVGHGADAGHHSVAVPAAERLEAPGRAGLIARASQSFRTFQDRRRFFAASCVHGGDTHRRGRDLIRTGVSP